MSLSAWLKSSVVSSIYLDFGVESSVLHREFQDFSVVSGINSNPYRDMGLISEMLDLSGDFALESSLNIGATGSFDLASSYIKGASVSSFAMLSSFVEYDFFSHSINSTITISTEKDFGIKSLFRRSIRTSSSLKSFVEEKAYFTSNIKSSFAKRYGFFGKSLSMHSSFIERKAIRFWEISDTGDSVYIFTKLRIDEYALVDSRYLAGRLIVDVDTSLDSATFGLPVLSVSSLVSLADVVKLISEEKDTSIETYDGAMYSFATIEYDSNPLTDYMSNHIVMSITRYIEDSIFREEDYYAIKMNVENYPPQKSDTFKMITTAYDSIQSVLKNSIYFELIKSSYVNIDDSLRLIDDMIFLFWINRKPNNKSVSDSIFVGVVNGFTEGRPYIAHIMSLVTYSFDHGESKAKRELLADSAYMHIISIELHIEDIKKFSVESMIRNATLDRFYADVDDVTDGAVQISGSKYLITSSLIEQKIPSSIALISDSVYMKIVDAYDEYTLSGLVDDIDDLDINIEKSSGFDFIVSTKIVIGVFDLISIESPEFHGNIKSKISISQLTDYYSRELVLSTYIIYENTLVDIEDFIHDFIVPLPAFLENYTTAKIDFSYHGAWNLNGIISGDEHLLVNVYYNGDDAVFYLSEAKVY